MTLAAVAAMWPPQVTLTPTDVLFDDISLADTAMREGTPCLRIAATPRPNRHYLGDRLPTLLVTRVTSIDEWSLRDGREIWVDADLGRCRPLLDGARVIGRPTARRHRRFSLRPRPSWAPSGTAHLTDDLRVGDLIAIPCDGPFALADVRRRDRTDPVDADPDWWSHCGR